MTYSDGSYWLPEKVLLKFFREARRSFVNCVMNINNREGGAVFSVL